MRRTATAIVNNQRVTGSSFPCLGLRCHVRVLEYCQKRSTENSFLPKGYRVPMTRGPDVLLARFAVGAVQPTARASTDAMARREGRVSRYLLRVRRRRIIEIGRAHV